jgi:hypothetical protein
VNTPNYSSYSSKGQFSHDSGGKKKIHTVPELTLRARIKGRPSRRDIMPNSRKLTNLEEEAVFEHIDLYS